LWLVLFHVALLYSRFADASITQPGVLARWIASLFLIAGGIAAMRYARTQRRARHAAFAIGVLILLLHVSIPMDERLLSTTGNLAAVVQTALSMAPAALLLTVLLVLTSLVAVNAVSFHQLTFAPRRLASRTASAPRSPPSN
jgi:predicted transporter